MGSAAAGKGRRVSKSGRSVTRSGDKDPLSRDGARHDGRVRAGVARYSVHIPRQHTPWPAPSFNYPAMSSIIYEASLQLDWIVVGSGKFAILFPRKSPSPSPPPRPDLQIPTASPASSDDFILPAASMSSPMHPVLISYPLVRRYRRPGYCLCPPTRRAPSPRP